MSNSSACPAPADSSASSPLFPETEPYQSGWLTLHQGHEIYYEQCGNPAGLPVLFLHGGPAGGLSPRQRRFFDPARYRICLLDQRGCGKSRPYGERQHNHTDALIDDIERLRAHLHIERWLIFGGSWGSALALAYASRHRQACLGLILRGIFLTGQADMDWFFEHARQLLPDAWARFSAQVGQTESRAILNAYTEALENIETPAAQAAAQAWQFWETALSSPGRTPPAVNRVDLETVRKYRLQASYLNRLCDLGESAVLHAAGQAASLPTVIVHGRLDWVCRPENAWRLSRHMPGSRLRLLAGAAHDPYSAPMLEALISATNLFARDGHFEQWTADGKFDEPQI